MAIYQPLSIQRYRQAQYVETILDFSKYKILTFAFSECSTLKTDEQLEGRWEE